MKNATLEQTPMQHPRHSETTRLRFKNVLVATDLSEQSEDAVQAGMEIASRFGSNLFVAHVLTPVIMPDPSGVMAPNLLRAQETAARARLDAIASMAAMKHIAHSEMLLRYGTIVATINEIIEAHGIDLLVLATHGRKGLNKVMLGSVAESLLRETHCPVLMIGPHAKSASQEYQMKFKSLLLPVDLDSDSLRAAQYATSLAAEMDAKITLLSVVPSLSDTKDASTTRREMITGKMWGLWQLLPAEATLWFHPNLRVEEGDVAVQILAAARQEKAELIVMKAREPKPLSDHASWATLSKIVSHAHCPVLAVRSLPR